MLYYNLNLLVFCFYVLYCVDKYLWKNKIIEIGYKED